MFHFTVRTGALAHTVTPVPLATLPAVVFLQLLVWSVPNPVYSPSPPGDPLNGPSGLCGRLGRHSAVTDDPYVAVAVAADTTAAPFWPAVQCVCAAVNMQ